MAKQNGKVTMNILNFRRCKKFATSAFLMFALSACGLNAEQREAVEKFGKAASAMGELTAQQVVEAREALIALNTHYMAVKPGENPNNVDGALTPEATSARVKAARTVQTYGALLKALVEESQTDELTGASSEFTGSVRALDTKERVISDDQLNAIGKIVAGIGGLWVEGQKAKAVKKIVPMAHEQVKMIGKLLKDEFSAPNGAVPSYLDVRAKKVLLFSGDVLENTQTPVTERRIAAEAKRFGLAVEERANIMLPAVSVAAEKMVAAHGQLVLSLKEDNLSLSDINEFVKSVEDLFAAAKVFST